MHVKLEKILVELREYISRGSEDQITEIYKTVEPYYIAIQSGHYEYHGERLDISNQVGNTLTAKKTKIGAYKWPMK